MVGLGHAQQAADAGLSRSTGTPTMAGYVSTSGPIGLGSKIYDGLFDYDNDGKISRCLPKVLMSVQMARR